MNRTGYPINPEESIKFHSAYTARVIVLIALFFLLACSTGQWNPERIVDGVLVQMRAPGEKLLDTPDNVRSKYKCASRKLPFIQIIDNELLPTQVVPGEKMNHHLVYVMCPENPTEISTGTLHREVMYKGKLLSDDDSEIIEFKPGKWSVDAFLKIQLTAEPGAYSLTMRFENNDFEYQKSLSFLVLNK